MKLTKKQRNKVYRKMLKLMEEYNVLNIYGCFFSGFCFFIKEASNCFYQEIKLFPELMECRPEGKLNYHYWFPATSEHSFLRIWIVMYAIEKTN